MAAVNVCVGCGAKESPTRRGATYDLTSAQGEKLRAWLCNDCAIPLGLPQGPVTIKPGAKAK